MGGTDAEPAKVIMVCSLKSTCEYPWCDHYEHHAKDTDCKDRVCITKNGKLQTTVSCKKKDDDFESMF